MNAAKEFHRVEVVNLEVRSTLVPAAESLERDCYSQENPFFVPSNEFVRELRDRNARSKASHN
jgi:hypothetical protein